METKLNVYYAHFMGIYNTPQEERDIATLEALGFNVINPNTPGIQVEVDTALKQESYMDMFNTVFFSRVRECEVFAFRALPDGRIPGGVALEMEYAKDKNKLIIELPSGFHSRKMGKDDTREYLKEIGQR